MIVIICGFLLYFSLNQVLGCFRNIRELHDQEFKIPLIKKAIQAAGGTLMLYAIPWSPPDFMKINDFNNGTVGWTDWNILLDQGGGPNHVGNFCFAPIHGDTENGELIYTPTYYYIGHFSKFIRPGAKRISTVSSRSHLLSTSFQNEDGSLVNVIMNQSDEAIYYQEGQPSRWLRIYPLYIELLERRTEVQTYTHTHLYPHFTFRYDRSSLERLIEQSRLNAGAYCFDQAATSFPAARANEKIAARTAYRWLLRALKYVPEDNTYQGHLAEMYDWGTVRIFVQGLSYFNPAWFPLEATFAPSVFLFHQRDWIEIHYSNAVQRRIDYEAIVDVTEVYVGRNEEVESTECFSAEVITGYRTETKKVWQDSVWVEVKEEVPIYTTVTATITTVEQYKEAWSRAQIQLIPVAGLRPGTWWNTAPSVDWSNTYEICSGDDRALPSSCSGSCGLCPSDRSMVRDLGRAIRRNLVGRLCHYFPDTHLRRRDRKALGW